MVDRFVRLVTSISQLYRCIQKIKSKEMTEFGLKGTHVMCLFYLRQHPDGLTSAELSNLCLEDKAAISRTVSKLEELGLTATACNGPKRRYRAKILLTNAGQRISEQMLQIIENAVEKGGAGITDAERATFYQVLDVIPQNLQVLCAEGAAETCIL